MSHSARGSSQSSRVSRLPVRESVHNQSRTSSVSKLSLRPDSCTKFYRSSSISNLVEVRKNRSGSLVRQTYCTPLSQPRYSRLTRKSPGYSSVKKDNRPITDKNWQLDQLSKVRHFVSKYFGHLQLYDVSTIKSGISMDLFISLMNNYIQLLDHRAFFKRENYVDEIPKILKVFGYPVTVKPSLMKTINTPHAWPHILAIFSWLSDIYSEIDLPDNYAPFSGIYNIVYEDALGLLNQLEKSTGPMDGIRQKCLDKIDKEIVNYLNIDIDCLADIDNQIKNLQSDIERFDIKKKDIENNIKSIQTETNGIMEKCDAYELKSKTFLTQLEQQKKKHMEKIHSMSEELSTLRGKEQCIQAVIDSQPYSLTEKEILAKEVASLQVSKDLKEQRQIEQQNLIHKYDSNLTELMQRLQSSAYKYNNMVNNLELSNSEFKKLHIRETGFARNDTEKELQSITKLIKVANIKIQKGIQSYTEEIEKQTEKQKKLGDSLDDVSKEVDELKKLDGELVITQEFENKQADLKRRQCSEEITKSQSELAEIKKAHLDVEPLQKQADTLEKQLGELEHILGKNKSESCFFFQQLQKQTNATALAYMDIMDKVSELFENKMAGITNKTTAALNEENSV